MRNDPLFFLWIVSCPTPELSRTLPQQLLRELSGELILMDEVRHGTDRTEIQRREPHRLGDYFESVRVLPDECPDASSFGLLFHRRPDASRYWKDFMVRILQSVRNAGADSPTLAYQGDENPRPANTLS